MRHCIYACGVLVLCVIPAHAALFAVAAATFSGYAQCWDGTYSVTDPAVGGRISRTKLRNGRLYFSFRVIGEDGAIEYLKEHGALEVFVEFWAGGQKLGERSIGIDQANWEKNGSALADEKIRTGIFNWRTCAYTEQVTSSSVQIQIRDANADFAHPLDFEGSYQPGVIIDPK